MPRVTRITQQKDQNRVNIYLDDKFAFGVTLESLMQNSLSVGKELTSDQVALLKSQGDKDKVFGRVLRFVTSRPHSEKEVNLWFKKKKVDDPDVIKSVFDRLKKLELVDDEKFAKWWIEQRNTFRPKPVRVLKLELQQKGVSKDVIDEAFGQTEQESELELGIRVGQKRLSRLKLLPNVEQKKKLSEFLARRGFSWDVVKSVVEKLLTK